MKPSVTKTTPTRFGFLLLNDFTLMSLASAIEPLRMANRISGKPHYRWLIIAEDGGSVAASDGVCVAADADLRDKRLTRDLEVIFVCGGIRVEKNTTDPVLRFLRAAHQKGVALGGLCTGSWALAEAGLLDGYRCSIHWENLAALADLQPAVNVRRRLFTLDRNRLTCSGGTAPIDMFVHIINTQLGAEVSAAIADQLICERVRQADDPQRIPLKHLIGGHSKKLIDAIELMEANLKEPISQEELAAYVELSRRQLQRLFQKHLYCTPSRYYLQLRLHKARELLRQTGLSILEISVGCGFVSTSHFSKSYKAYFGYSPSQERQRRAIAS